MAIAAHPDDTELCCSGTLASLSRKGLNVGVVDLTQGEMGTRGTPEERLEEASNASKIVGLKVRDNLGLPDCNLDNTPQHREAIIKVVRTYRPDICLISAPEDRHPDHGNASRLVIDALYYSGLLKLETAGKDSLNQAPWRPSHILHYMQDRPFEPTFVYDISDTIEIKEQAILSFRTQFNVSENDDGPKTYISSNTFFKNVRARARHYGHMIGVEFGEPFLYHGGPVPLHDLNVLLNSKPIR